jgi:hypothetical protein
MWSQRRVFIHIYLHPCETVGFREAAGATCCCGGRRCGGGSNNSKINIWSSSSLLRSKTLRIFALFIGWGSWWVYCSIEAISPSNVWIDFAKITLAKLCVRTCCRRHESSSSSRSLPWMDGRPNGRRDERQNERMEKDDHLGLLYK